jgi:hypothetical protein
MRARCAGPPDSKLMVRVMSSLQSNYATNSFTVDVAEQSAPGDRVFWPARVTRNCK